MMPFTVHTPDGIALAGSLAQAPEPRGTVIIRTPYDRTVHDAQARSWQARGYTCLIADVRGRYESTGPWHPYHREGADGEATVRAVLGATWHRGGITLLGSSYAAHCALETARTLTGTPDLAARLTGVVALVPALGRYETARDPQGRPRLRDRLGWWFEHGFGARSGPPLGDERAAALLSHAESAGPEATHPLPNPTLAEAALWRELWAAPRTDLRSRYARVTPPLLVVTGTTDFFVQEALDLYDSWPQPANLICGPWGHRLTADRTAGRPADPREKAPGHGDSIGARIVAWLQDPQSTPAPPRPRTP